MRSKFKNAFVGLTMLSIILAGTQGAMADSCSQTAVVYKNKTVTNKTNFKTVSIKDNTMLIGRSKVQKPGVSGKKLITYKIGTKCGKQVSKKTIKTVIKSKPVNKEVLVGNKEIAIETVDTSIPFTTQNLPDSALAKGTSRTIQTGINGLKRTTYELVKIDGNVLSRNASKEELIKPPVNQINKVGTKVAYSYAPSAESQTNSGCDPNYSPCIPYYAGNVLNCPDVGMRVRVIGTDHNRLDADGDGWGCDSY